VFLVVSIGKLRDEMGIYYSQTLIPKNKEFRPQAAQVGAFCSAMALLGVILPDAKATLHAHTGKTRVMRNPITRKEQIVPFPDAFPLDSLDQIEKAAVGHDAYWVEVGGMGQPKTVPLPLDFTGPYHVGVTCNIRSELVSTSDLHEESGSRLSATYYGEPCAASASMGLFSNPHNLEVIKVPDAGCAKFWLEINLGKGLFPRIEGGDLKILNPLIVEEAERAFDGVRFVQGCYWG
jgi:hypothetical protein